jgi:hypothetical protein
MNKGAINSPTQVLLCEHKFSFHLEKYLGVRLLASWQVTLNFMRNCQNFWKWIQPFTLDKQRITVPVTLHLAPALDTVGETEEFISFAILIDL